MKETNEDIFNKYNQLIKHSIKPIICVGEPLDARENSSFLTFIVKQLESFKDIEDELIIAYEPIWAIGSGLVPSIADINEVSKLIKEQCRNAKVLKIIAEVNVGMTKFLLDIIKIATQTKRTINLKKISDSDLYRQPTPRQSTIVQAVFMKPGIASCFIAKSGIHHE